MILSFLFSHKVTSALAIAPRAQVLFLYTD